MTTWAKTASRRAGFAGMLVLAAALVPAGCDASDSGPGADAVVVADGLADAVAVPTVSVVYQGETRTADLSKPARTTLGGLSFVALSTVVTQAFPDLDLAAVAADFEGADGFKPGSKGNCAALIPVPGPVLSQGYISPETRNLAWDDSLQYPGCLRVTNTAVIDLAVR